MIRNAVLMRRKAIEAIRLYRNELLKEFLLIVPELQKKLEKLLEKGTASKEYVCLRDAETEPDICYTVVSRNAVKELLKLIKSINKANAMKIFDAYTKIDEWPAFCDFKEFRLMEEIHDAYKNAELAENMINWAKTKTNGL